MGLYHPLDGATNHKHKLLGFLTPNDNNSKRKAPAFNWDRCCHLALCLQLILFHWIKLARCSSGSPYVNRRKRNIMARRQSVYKAETEQGRRCVTPAASQISAPLITNFSWRSVIKLFMSVIYKFS